MGQVGVRWTVRCYVSPQGVDEIHRWYENQPPAVQAKFVSRLQALICSPAHEWKLPLFRWLHGECAGLGEIRFKADVQQRPLGFCTPGHVFTLVLCAVEKGGKLVPKEACAIGLRRKEEVNSDASRAVAFWIRPE